MTSCAHDCSSQTHKGLDRWIGGLRSKSIPSEKIKLANDSYTYYRSTLTRAQSAKANPIESFRSAKQPYYRNGLGNQSAVTFKQAARLAQDGLLQQSHTNETKQPRILLSAPVPIRNIIRPMRGGSQSYLVQTDDYTFFVAKFKGNPQGDRTLINEMLASTILSRMGISIPRIAVLDLQTKVLEEKPIFFSIGTKQIPIAPGLHFGSEVPVNPEKNAIFDLLPEKLLSSVVNLDHFGFTFVSDVWLHMTDRRQTVYFRERGATPFAFRAMMIDHGLCFGGKAWNFEEWPVDVTTCISKALQHIDIKTVFMDGMSRIMTFPENLLDETIRQIPETWFRAGDRERLENLIDALWKRRLHLPRLIEQELGRCSPSSSRADPTAAVGKRIARSV